MTSKFNGQQNHNHHQCSLITNSAVTVGVRRNHDDDDENSLADNNNDDDEGHSRNYQHHHERQQQEFRSRIDQNHRSSDSSDHHRHQRQRQCCSSESNPNSNGNVDDDDQKSYSSSYSCCDEDDDDDDDDNNDDQEKNDQKKNIEENNRRMMMIGVPIIQKNLGNTQSPSTQQLRKTKRPKLCIDTSLSSTSSSINDFTSNNNNLVLINNNESDTPVPTPPPPPNSSKPSSLVFMKCHHHHHHHHQQKQQQHHQHSSALRTNNTSDSHATTTLHHYHHSHPLYYDLVDPTSTSSSPPSSSSVHHHHYHHHQHHHDPQQQQQQHRDQEPLYRHHHHHDCVVHTSSSSSSAMPSNSSSSHSHHKRKKRKHRDSKRRRFRFSFRTKNVIATTSMLPTPLHHQKQQQHHQSLSCHHHHHQPHSSLCAIVDAETSSSPVRASSIITSSTSTTSVNSTLITGGNGGANSVTIAVENQSVNSSLKIFNPDQPNEGLKSKKLKPLIHPLDRSIVGIITLTIFFTILAILTGVPIVLCLFLLLPVAIFMKKLFLCSFFGSWPNHEPVSSIDSYWLNQGHITHCLLYVDKGLSVQQLRDVIAARLLTQPELARFKSRLIFKGLGKSPYWKYDATLDNVEEHVIEDEPIQCKKSLRMRLMTLMSQSIPMEKPLWQIRYSTATYCNQVVLIIRVHQALSQSGLVSILTHYLSDSIPACASRKPRFGSVTLSINILRAIIVGPLTFVLWMIWAFTRRHYNRLSKAREIKSIHWSTLDLPRIYRIKQVTRSTLNDVLLASIAGSIRSYLVNRTNIINPPDLTISIPVDIRSSSPIESSLIGVNYVLTTSPIPTNTEGAIPRLWEVRHLMEELKASADTAVMYGCHYLLSRLLPRPLYRFLVNLVNRNSSVYMSNMPGPETSLSIGSHRLAKVYYFLSSPSYCSIVYNIFTYNEKIHMSITTHSKLIPNAKELMRQFRAQINVLHELLSKRRVPGESKRIRRPLVSDLSTDQLYQNQLSSTGVVSLDQSGTQIADLSTKLHEIQDELNRLTGAYEMGDQAVVRRYEELKEEFTTLLYEMRRRKSLADYGNVMINIENEEDDDNDGELRSIPRRFSVVSIGRRASIVSSLPSSSRVTPPILSRRSMATSPEPPSSPEMAFKVETEC